MLSIVLGGGMPGDTTVVAREEILETADGFDCFIWLAI